MKAIQTITTRENLMKSVCESMPNGTSITKAIQLSGKGCCGSAHIERAY